MRGCAGAWVRGCVRACVRACMRACVRAWVRAMQSCTVPAVAVPGRQCQDICGGGCGCVGVGVGVGVRPRACACVHVCVLFVGGDSRWGGGGDGGL